MRPQRAAYVSADRSGDAELQNPAVRGTAFSTRTRFRVRGVLKTYRPPGQTNWSKALVRQGADARVALATVLGVPAEDIRAREGTG